MSTQDQDFTPYQELLPEGALPISGVRIVSYFAEDGTVKYKLSHIVNDGSAFSLIGLLDLVKHEIMNATVVRRPDEK